jgi:hypothetical protein
MRWKRGARRVYLSLRTKCESTDQKQFNMNISNPAHDVVFVSLDFVRRLS